MMSYPTCENLDMAGPEKKQTLMETIQDTGGFLMETREILLGMAELLSGETRKGADMDRENTSLLQRAKLTKDLARDCRELALMINSKLI